LWLNEAEVAHLCGVSRQTLWNRRRKHQPPVYYRLFGKIWYKPADIEAFIQAGRNA
jgi:predicted DNA-binding transcriptional regulator AlpA